MCFSLDLIYELTIAERDFRSEGRPICAEFMKAVHVVSSMARGGRSQEEILSYVADFYTSDLKSEAKFSLLKGRLKL